MTADYGFWSVLPPLITIALALISKNVFLSLLVGIFTGSIILKQFSVFAGLNAGLYSIADSMNQGNTLIIGSILLTGAVITLCEKSGGVEGFVNLIVKKKALIKSKRGANLFTWLLGLAIFTSGTLSCMITGSVSRPVNDALKVPHEKAAYIVHTTSTPWCVLFPFSGWLASMAAYLVSGGVPKDGAVNLVFQSIPLNFYCILSIVMVLILALTQKDFGPMAKAEKRAETTGELDSPAHKAAAVSSDTAAAQSGVTPRAVNLLVPIGVMIAVMILVLVMTNSGTAALLWAVVTSLLVASVMCLAEKVFTASEVVDRIFDGMKGMLPMAMILVFGFTMGNIVKSLKTGNYLAGLFLKGLTPALLPVLVFLLGLVISFATGTSMGTMAIVAVIALPMAYSMGSNIALVAGAVFGGSIFGDHASPISDTTIMTCSTTGCDIIDHVKTQMPYAAVCAGASILLYLICGFVMH